MLLVLARYLSEELTERSARPERTVGSETERTAEAAPPASVITRSLLGSAEGKARAFYRLHNRDVHHGGHHALYQRRPRRQRHPGAFVGLGRVGRRHLMGLA